MRWLENGHVSVYRANAHYANGNTRDRQGRLITCEHDTRRVTRTEPDGTITVLIDRFDGKPLNAPNDVVVASDHAIWFTDPGYGIDGNYEGHRDKAELPTRVYRLDPSTGQAKVAAEGIDRPNGLAFSPDETTLYVVDSGITHGGGPTSAPSRSRATGSPATASSRKASRGLHRRNPDRRRWQCVVLDGMGRPERGWRALLCAVGRPDRQDPSARDLRQSLLRRPEEEPAVHGGEHIDLRGLCRDAGGDAAVGDLGSPTTTDA